MTSTSFENFMERMNLDLEAPAKPPKRPLAASAESADVVVTPDTIRDLRSALAFLRADDRELWVRIGHALNPLGDTGRGLWLEWSATSAKFDPATDSAQWETFRPTRTGYQAVFAEAQRQGWVNPATHAAPDYDASASAVDLEQNLVGFDTRENPFDDLPHIVNPWLPCDEVTSLPGHGGSGKSYAALILAVHVCLGWLFAGLVTTQSRVLFFSAEDGARVLRQRLAKICRALAIDPAQLDGKLFLLDASDLDPTLYREQRHASATETPLLGALAALVAKLDVGLTIIDNASDVFGGNEIARAEVRGFVRSLRQRLARPGRAVLLLAHVNKASATHGKLAGSEDYSGSTAWHNSVRSRLSLTADGDNALKIEHMKANHGAMAAPVRLVWHEGVPMVSGSYTDAGAASARAAEKDQDTADKLALVALIQDFDRRGERVTTSSQGSATAHRLLKGQPGFPKSTDSERLMRLLRELETEGGIYRRNVKTADRKFREVFTCASLAPESAPIPNGQALQAAGDLV